MGSRAAKRTAAGLVLVLALAAPGIGTSARAAEPGQVIWSDLVSEDAEAAAAFYTTLFGWRVEERAPGVKRLWLGDRELGAIHQISDRMPATVESTWLVGVAVADLEGTVRAFRRGGGAVLREVTEVPGEGRFAVVRDPRGAVLLLIDTAHEVNATRAPGAPVWAELWTDDLDGAAAFYADAVGYGREEVEVLGSPYTVLTRDGEPRAGLVATPSPSIRPAWVPYVAVEDLTVTLNWTRDLGGRVLLEPRADFAAGRVALIADPTGGALFVVQLPEKEDSQ